MRCALIVCWILVISIMQGAEGEEHARIHLTNLELLQRVALSASERIVAQVQVAPSQAFFVLNVSPKSLDWVAEEALTSALMLKGHRVFKAFLGGDSTATFSFRVIELSVAYQERSDYVERTARAKISFSVTKGQANLVLSRGEGLGSMQDIVPKAQLPNLEVTEITPIRMSTNEGMGRLVEPTLLSVVVAGIIYLFYANKAAK